MKVKNGGSIFGTVSLLILLFWKTLLASPDVLQKGLSLEKAGNQQEALKTYQEGLSKNPEPCLYVAAGALLGKMGKFQEGIDLLSQALKKFPRETKILNLKGLLHSRNGETKQACELWQSVLKIDPSNKNAGEWMARNQKPSLKIVSPGPENPTDKPEKLEDGEETGSLSGEWGPDFFNSTEPVNKLEEQVKLGKALIAEVVGKKVPLEKLEKTYVKVMRLCPDTGYAPLCGYKLVNLEIYGKIESDKMKAMAAIEHITSRYNIPELGPVLIPILLSCYEDTGNYRKEIAFFEAVFTRTSEATFPPELWAQYKYRYGQALEKTGEAPKAGNVYQEILTKAPNTYYGEMVQDLLIPEKDKE